jgi:hypothetical protein
MTIEVYVTKHALLSRGVRWEQACSGESLFARFSSLALMGMAGRGHAEDDEGTWASGASSFDRASLRFSNRHMV